MSAAAARTPPGAAAPGLLEAALHVSESLLDAARAGRWDEVRALCPERDAAMRMALSSDNPDYPHRLDMQAVLRLAALDREALAAAALERDASRTRIAHARKVGKARDAYAR